jgi:hypothetical protein
VGAEAVQVDGHWQVTKALMSRSARILMEGWCAFRPTVLSQIGLQRLCRKRQQLPIQ